MGIFDFFKKKQQDSTKPIDGITHSTWLPTSTCTSEKHINSCGDDLSHLTSSGELPFGWVAYNQDFIKEQDKKIDDEWHNVYVCQSKTEKIDAYRKYFETINKVGEVCKKNGECHYKWFCENVIESTWYNSQVKAYEKLKKKGGD